MTAEDRRVWFNIALTQGLGPVAAQKIFAYLDDRRLPACSLVGLDSETLQRCIGISGGVASALHNQLQDQIALPQEPDRAEMLVPGDDRFPNSRFRDANPPLPPVLWAAAESSLLAWSGPSLAVAGSRDTSEEILERVHDICREASRDGWMIVSGLAQGVDTAAHRGALAGRAGTIGVLASGIESSPRELVSDDAERICVVSQFSPREPWSGPRAMQRNSTIAALADRVFVAAAGTSGGSWEMAQLCLKRGKPLFVLDLSDDLAAGNRKLIKAGATAVDPDAPEQLFAKVPNPERSPAAHESLTLFD